MLPGTLPGTLSGPPAPRRHDARTVLHFDYDCFYASVVEAQQPALRGTPVAVQQKQIIVTCNYAARARGLYKLQLVADARRLCPDVVIVLGEDLTRFRDASKALYAHLRGAAWSGRVERLGFDEVWMDVGDMVDYNVGLLNLGDLAGSFFCTARDDPTRGFSFDASAAVGHVEPAGASPRLESYAGAAAEDAAAAARMVVGSHLAQHLRHSLEEALGYTATCGIATSKLTAKLVGSTHKPRAQTVLMPPLAAHAAAFMRTLDIGRVPSVGFKHAQRLRQHVLGRPADHDTGLVYGGTKEHVSVADVLAAPGMGPAMLDRVLGVPGPGTPAGSGLRVWNLLHGADDSPVAPARSVPRQISIEDSYMHLDRPDTVERELETLSARLISRMRVDLMEVDGSGSAAWVAWPTVLRLTTRPKPRPGPDGVRPRSFARISRSARVPGWLFELPATPGPAPGLATGPASAELEAEGKLEATGKVETATPAAAGSAGPDSSSRHTLALARRLVREVWLPLFRRLHPEPRGWNLSLVNVAVAGIEEPETHRPASPGTTPALSHSIQAAFGHGVRARAAWDAAVGAAGVGEDGGAGHDYNAEADGRVTDQQAEERDAEPGLDAEPDVDVADQKATADEMEHDTEGEDDFEFRHDHDDDYDHDEHDEGMDKLDGGGGSHGSPEPGSPEPGSPSSSGPDAAAPCAQCGAALPAFARAAHARWHRLGA